MGTSSLFSDSLARQALRTHSVKGSRCYSQDYTFAGNLLKPGRHHLMESLAGPVAARESLFDCLMLIQISLVFSKHVLLDMYAN